MFYYFMVVYISVQRMAREQEDYVRKQEAKRQKARQMRAAYDNRGDETDEEKFSDFFNVRNFIQKEAAR